MRILILWADDKSANLGVRALAEGTSALVRTVWPDAEISFQNFGQRVPELPVGRLRSLVKERITAQAGMQRWLANFDLILDTRSGDSFADIYGLRRLRLMTAVAEFAMQAGTPVVLSPQTIGPFESGQGRWLGRRSLRRARLVMARDTQSAEYASRIGRPVDVLTTDVVFSLPVPSVEKSRDIILNISGLLWNSNPHVDAATYRATTAQLYRELEAQGRRVSLMAHVLESPVSDNDVPAMREFARSYAPHAEQIVPYGLSHVREVVASAALVFGSRMHACLNALSVGTPAIPLAYSRKFEPLLGDLDWDAAVDLRIDSDVSNSALRMMHREGLVERARGVQERAQDSLRSASDALAAIA